MTYFMVCVFSIIKIVFNLGHHVKLMWRTSQDPLVSWKPPERWGQGQRGNSEKIFHMPNGMARWGCRPPALRFGALERRTLLWLPQQTHLG